MKQKLINALWYTAYAVILVAALAASWELWGIFIRYHVGDCP